MLASLYPLPLVIVRIQYEAISAIRAFNGTEFGGRLLLVNEARERGAREYK